MGGLMSSVENSITSNITDIINHSNNIVMNDIHELNKEFYEGYQWIACLDSTTCLACAELDNKIVKDIGDFPSEPPLHKNCRCIIVPVLEGMKDHYTQTQINYKDWFERQDTETKLDILGPSRYKEYLNGKELTYFAKDGRIMTLDELGIERTTRIELFAVNSEEQLKAFEHYKEYWKVKDKLTDEEKDEFKKWITDTLMAKIPKNQLTGIKSGIKTIADNLVNDLDKFPPVLQRMLYQTRPDINIKTRSERAYFKPSNNSIHFGLKHIGAGLRQRVTFWHELAHALDHRLGQYFGGGEKNYPSNKLFALLGNEFDSYFNKLSITDKEAIKIINNVNNPLWGYESQGASDIIRGLTNSKYGGNWGHKKSYYNNFTTRTEALSHFTTEFIKNGGIKSYFPDNWQYFNDWLNTGNMPK